MSDDHPEPATPPEPVTPRRRVAFYVVIPVALLLCWGIYIHWRQSTDARETQQQSRAFVPDVHVVSATRSKDTQETVLPGQTAAFASADLFARATGFIAERHADIGSRVHKGDLLVRIAAPDLDEQLNQAQAQLGQMQAALTQAQLSLKQAQDNKKLANVNNYRASTLAREGWGTQQTADTNSTNALVSVSSVSSAQAGIGVAVANIRAQQATVDRLVALIGFEQVRAPFDGVITQRDIDIGDLVQSGSTSGTALFHIDQEDVLRCEVYVPQSHFAGIHSGIDARITVPELPGKVFSAKVSRTSVSLAQNSRSMLAEIDVPNENGALTPGLFVDVAFVLQSSPTVLVPDAALIFDAGGLRVATVAPDQRIHMTAVTVYRDLGEKAEIREGLKGGESLVVNPPSDLTDGQKIHVVNDADSGTRSKS